MTERKYKKIIFQWQDGWGEYKTEIKIVKDNGENFELKGDMK